MTAPSVKSCLALAQAQGDTDNAADHRDHQGEDSTDHPLDRSHFAPQAVHLGGNLLPEALEAIPDLLT